MAERRHHLLIDLALEGYDQAGQVCHRPPGPLVEFGLMASRRRVDANLFLLAMEAEGEPFLLLPAIFSIPGDADAVGRQVVLDPAGSLLDELEAFHSRFLEYLAISCPERLLPGTPANPYQAAGIQDHQPDAGAIRQTLRIDGFLSGQFTSSPDLQPRQKLARSRCLVFWPRRPRQQPYRW